ncbi:MAG: hypothetical protein ACRC54_01135 [Fusobacteriaceae bacterium]
MNFKINIKKLRKKFTLIFSNPLVFFLAISANKFFINKTAKVVSKNKNTLITMQYEPTF